MGIIYQVRRRFLEKREEYSIYRKYVNKPRFTQCKAKYKHRTFIVPDAPSFAYQVLEIFGDDIYKFKSNTDKPLIYDIGANIGISVFYFKTLFPNSHIKAYEADQKIYDILKNNVSDLTNIELYNNAVWINNEELSFSSQGADGGSIMTDYNEKQKVKAVRLKTLLENEDRIDFLKMDIEGAETEVIPDCKDVLNKADNIFIEYHSFTKQKQALQTILSCLSDAGFRYYLQPVQQYFSPLCYDFSSDKMDLQVNIFGYRGK